MCATTLPARAESLIEALAAAYANNPELNAERSALRATDEEVPRARSGFRPNVNGNATASREVSRTRRRRSAPAVPGGPVNVDQNWPSSYSVTVTQNLFNGLQNVNAVREAEANVSSGRETLRSVEQDVLLAAVTAYTDVLRDQSIVRLRQNNATVLFEQLKATQDRFDVGEVTRTDVAQSQASHAAALSAVQLAQANLKASRADYERIMGHAPAGLLDPGPASRLMPRSLDEAIYIGDSENPDIQAAVFAEAAAGYALKRIMGELLPQVTLEATYDDRNDPTSILERQETGTFMGRVNVPLYQGGEVAARVRQAKDVNLQRRRELDQARALIRSDVVAEWGRFFAAQAQIISDESAVSAARIALAGVREEEKVGQRTVLDVLDAQQTLLDAEVTLVTTRRDMVVASYTLLSAIGRLDAVTLGLPIELYDPTDHYRRVKGKWFGLNAEPRRLLDR